MSEWRQIASGDASNVPGLEIPTGQPWRIEVDLPFAVPDAVAGALGSAVASALGVFMTVTSVTVSGALLVVEGPG